jgi:hypothetical protein
VVSADSPKIPRVPGYSGVVTGDRSAFAYRAVTLYGVGFHRTSANRRFCDSLPARQSWPNDPNNTACATAAALARTRFRLLRFRSPLLTEYLFLRVLRCFSSPGALSLAYVFNQECLGITPGGFPHSEIAGSSFASNSPTLIAGSRVLLRRLVPRHPPWTLSSLPCLHPLFSR